MKKLFLTLFVIGMSLQSFSQFNTLNTKKMYASLNTPAFELRDYSDVSTFVTEKSKNSYNPWDYHALVLSTNLFNWSYNYTYSTDFGNRTGFIPIILSYYMPAIRIFSGLGTWADYLQLGAWASFNSTGWKYGDDFASWKNSYNTFFVGVAALYYFNAMLNMETSKFNVYAVLRLGIGFEKYKSTVSISDDLSGFAPGLDDLNSSSSRALVRLMPAIAASYMFTQVFSAYIQAGYNPHGPVELGVKYNIK